MDVYCEAGFIFTDYTDVKGTIVNTIVNTKDRFQVFLNVFWLFKACPSEWVEGSSLYILFIECVIVKKKLKSPLYPLLFQWCLPYCHVKSTVQASVVVKAKTISVVVSYNLHFLYM